MAQRLCAERGQCGEPPLRLVRRQRRAVQGPGQNEQDQRLIDRSQYDGERSRNHRPLAGYADEDDGQDHCR